jgi:hypothetical protein
LENRARLIEQHVARITLYKEHDAVGAARSDEGHLKSLFCGPQRGRIAICHGVQELTEFAFQRLRLKGRERPQGGACRRQDVRPARASKRFWAYALVFRKRH